MALASLLVFILVCLGACAPEHSSYSDFKDVPIKGWYRSMPLDFTPQYGDSSNTYNITLAVRHDNMYRYRNLSLIVDFIGHDKKVSRRNMNFSLADNHGNWLGSGFGALYQCSALIATGVHPSEMEHVVVWLGMGNCSFVTSVCNVGIIVSPSK